MLIKNDKTIIILIKHLEISTNKGYHSFNVIKKKHSLKAGNFKQVQIFKVIIGAGNTFD